MTAQFSNFLINDPEISLQNRFIFYVSTMESVCFPSDVNPKCLFCGDPNYVPPEPQAKPEESKEAPNPETPEVHEASQSEAEASIPEEAKQPQTEAEEVVHQEPVLSSAGEVKASSDEQAAEQS
mmetsp:Transcript_29608/g.52852  ORF Transcript_29608/g.52852 Transcript_29608/m.52852 type:complete len:124 (-) Transcript_29608:305-676(-)